MKTVNIKVLLLLLLIPISIFSQEENKRPKFITVTTGYWNMDYENFDKEKWIATEKEFLDNVTKKNEYVLGASVYLHRFTPDNSEIIFVTAYPSWEAIEKSSLRNEELIKSAWSNEADRKEYFKKRNAYYAHTHSDEIYVPIGNAKPIKLEDAKKELVWLAVKGHFAYPEEGTKEEFLKLNKEFIDNVIMKNDLIKGYYQHGHAWGSDKTEFSRAVAFESMDDLDKSYKKSDELFKAHWNTEEKRKEFRKKMGKYFTPNHGDFIYTSVPELSK
ncbi:hypothetical protein [Tenacibaculum crassostreae]|uniref:hypothetical protein n=1 Tax=Tenacibaculum crassostreae TaxID=502683 RepID=UPI003895CA47